MPVESIRGPALGASLGTFSAPIRGVCATAAGAPAAAPVRRVSVVLVALVPGRQDERDYELAPDGTPQGLLNVVQWPDARHPALVVGHQPTLGRVVAGLLGIESGECSIRKGAVWWLRRRERHQGWQTVLLCVQSPELL